MRSLILVHEVVDIIEVGGKLDRIGQLRTE